MAEAEDLVFLTHKGSDAVTKVGRAQVLSMLKKISPTAKSVTCAGFTTGQQETPLVSLAVYLVVPNLMKLYFRIAGKRN